MDISNLGWTLGDLAVQAVSLVGAGAILLAYVLLQQGRWRAHQRRYLWANFAGGILLAAVALYDQRLGFILLEVAWAAVSLRSLLRTGARR